MINIIHSSSKNGGIPCSQCCRMGKYPVLRPLWWTDLFISILLFLEAKKRSTSNHTFLHPSLNLLLWWGKPYHIFWININCLSQKRMEWFDPANVVEQPNEPSGCLFGATAYFGRFDRVQNDGAKYSCDAGFYFSKPFRFFGECGNFLGLQAGHGSFLAFISNSATCQDMPENGTG